MVGGYVKFPFELAFAGNNQQIIQEKKTYAFVYGHDCLQRACLIHFLPVTNQQTQR